MKKSIFTALFITLGAIGLMAQSRNADTAKEYPADSQLKTHALTHADSVWVQKLLIDAQSQQEQDILVLPNSSRLPANGINDVIDVEHAIK